MHRVATPGMPSGHCGPFRKELYVATPPAPTPAVRPNPLPALVVALGRRNAARSSARCERRNGRASNEGGPQVLGLGDSRETLTRVSPMLTGAPNKARGRSAQPASEEGRRVDKQSPGSTPGPS
jgi:hypothetical protein